jgi:acyl-CoA synthetase (AMP-forming)/AMP-acid ligase II
MTWTLASSRREHLDGRGKKMAGERSTLSGLFPSVYASQTAVVLPDARRTVTYERLRAQVASLVETLVQGGIRTGDPVAIVLPNGLEYLASFLAVTWARAVAAPLNPAYKVEEFKFYMEDAGAQAVMVPPGDHLAREAAMQLGLPVWEAQLDASGRARLDGPKALSTATSDNGSPQPTDVALFLHTSGTTSRPKGVPLTHQNLMASLRNIVATYGLNLDDTSLVVMPLFHVHGLLGSTLSTLVSGGTVVIPPRFSAASFWQHAVDHRVTWYSAVPTIHQILLTRDDADRVPRRTLRFIRSCSAALAPSVFRQLEDRFGAPVLEAYGMTEAAHQMASNPQPPRVRKPGTVGIGTGVDIVILDELGNVLPPGQQGEVSIRGTNVMSGYRNNPEANSNAFTNGFFRTGDQGFLDVDGYLTLAGRIKELINRGGEKISPLEVDAVLLEHPAVAEAVCFAVPDTKYGEEVHGAVVLRAEASPDSIIAFCRGRLADFKVPKRIHVLEALPRTATGKIQRRHVAAHFLAHE